MGKRTYNVFRFGIWDSVEGSGPINWLFFNTLEVQLESQTNIKYTPVLLPIKSSTSRTYMDSNCFNFDIENGMSPCISLKDRSLITVID